eukprot:09706_1
MRWATRRARRVLQTRHQKGANEMEDCKCIAGFSGNAGAIDGECRACEAGKYK